MQDDDKLIAANTGNGLSAAGDGAEAGGDDEEELIAGIVTEGVVHVFEFVEIEVEDGDGGLVTARLFDGLIELSHEEAAIGEARKRVVVGEMLQLIFRLDALRNVVLDADEVSDVAVVVADGGEIELVPEEGSVFAEVTQDDAGILAFAEGLANFGQGGLIGIGALQKPAVTSADFAAV